MTPFAEYEIVPTRSGHPSAVHVPSQTLVHSRIDPWREAEEIIDSQSVVVTGTTLVIGGGLGYLPEVILRMRSPGHAVYVFEPDAGLRQLAMTCRPDASVFTSPSIRTATVSTHNMLQSRIESIPPDAEVIVSPYLLRLSGCQMSPLSSLLQVLRTEMASRCIYNPLLSDREQQNDLSALPAITAIRLPASKLTVVVGAGPSLDLCLDFLHRHRSHLIILAASGAVPSLIAGQVTPDWVFALEAKDTVNSDLHALPVRTRVVLFPSTHPDVIRSGEHNLYSGYAIGGDKLETRGGSSVIPAVDFALRSSLNNIVLIGMDLGYHNGAYADGSMRATEGLTTTNAVPPKFLAMRAGLECLLIERINPGRKVFHVLREGITLKGAERLQPERLAEVLPALHLHEVECE